MVNNEIELEELTFDDMCAEFRSLKIDEKTLKKKMKKLDDAIKKHAESTGFKGKNAGINVIESYSFLDEENVEIANKIGISVPTISSITLPRRKLEKMCELAEVDTSVIKSKTDVKALEKIFKDAEIEGVYSKTYRIALTKE